MITVSIVGVKNLQLPSLEKIVLEEAKKEAKKLKQEFGGTVTRWKRKPQFTITLQEGGNFEVGTDNEIYKYVDEGTKPHVIRAKNAPYLSFFRTGFVSKTKANSLNTRAGRAANQNFRQPQMVKHPGTKPRNFTKLIRERSRKRYGNNVIKAIKTKLIWGRV